MRIRALAQCDAPGPPGESRALFEGQVYDLPDDSARQLIEAGTAEEVVEAKAVDGPPSDKAVAGPPENKAPTRRRRRKKAEE